MAGYPYPYSVILDVPNNKYATGQLPNLPVYKEKSRKKTIESLIDISIKKLQSLSSTQNKLYMRAKEEDPELVKRILEGRVVALNELNETESIVTVFEQAEKIDSATIALMSSYKKNMDKFMEEAYARISTIVGKKYLKVDDLKNILNNILNDYTNKNAQIAGIAKQALSALAREPAKIVQLFKQIPKEKLELYNKKGISIQKFLSEKFIKDFLKENNDMTIDDLITLIKSSEETRNKFLADLSNFIKEIYNTNINSNSPIDKLNEEELKVELMKKLSQNEELFFQKSIALNIENPGKGKRKQRNYKTAKTGSDAIEVLCSFGNPLIDPEEIEKGKVQLFQTGRLTTRKTATLTFQNLSRKAKKDETNFDVLLDDLKKQKLPELKITSAFRADKADDIVKFKTKKGSNFTFQFSDKLIQRNSNGFNRGGLKDISMEGGTLFSTIQMLGNYGNISSMDELIFILLNQSSISAFKGATEAVDLQKFIKMILVSYIYMYAFNPQTEQINNEVANLAFSGGNTVYFHHIDTGIVPSYVLFNQTIKQLEEMKKDLDTLEVTNEFVKVIIEPSQSFTNVKDGLLNAAYKTNDPWGYVSNLVAYDTIVDIALDLFALGF